MKKHGRLFLRVPARNPAILAGLTLAGREKSGIPPNIPPSWRDRGRSLGDL
jgi:hypothetical protein